MPPAILARQRSQDWANRLNLVLMRKGDGDFGVDLDDSPANFETSDTGASEDQPRQHQQRRRRRTMSRKSFVSGRTAVIFGLVVTAVLLLSLPMREYFRQNSDINYARSESAKLQASVDRLQEQVNRWGNESYIRQQARERLNFVMPNEHAYVVMGSKQEQTDPERRAERQSQKQAWYNELWASVAEADTAGLGQQPDAEFPYIKR